MTAMHQLLSISFDRGCCLLRTFNRTFVGLIPAVAFALGISACDEGASEGEGGRAATSPSQVVTESDACTEVTTRSDMPSYRVELRLDVDKRILSLFGEDGTKLLAWRYDEAKRLVAKAGYPKEDGTSSGVFQHDYVYDAHGNQVDFRLSYPSSANIEVPSTAETWMGVRHENQYDPSGALISSKRSSYGLGSASQEPTEMSFRENAARACERVEYRGAITSAETRTYDAAGRISRIEASGRSVGLRRCSLWSKSWTYDDAGRPTFVREWCDATDPDTEPGRSVATTYHPDGSQRIEVIDRFTDVAPGVPVVIERSPSCALIDAWRGGPYQETHPTTSRCTL